MKTITFSYQTIYSDLDTQHHINSNRYFDLFESGKYLLLNKLGISNDFILSKQLKIEPYQTSFKFIKQVFENATIEVKISLKTYKDGYLSWTATMTNNDAICF